MNGGGLGGKIGDVDGDIIAAFGGRGGNAACCCWGGIGGGGGDLRP